MVRPFSTDHVVADRSIRVHHHDGAELFFIRTTLVVDGGLQVEGRCDLILKCGVRELNRQPAVWEPSIDRLERRLKEALRSMSRSVECAAVETDPL